MFENEFWCKSFFGGLVTFNSGIMPQGLRVGPVACFRGQFGFYVAAGRYSLQFVFGKAK